MAYRYQKNGKFLVCIDQSIPSVIRRLVFGYKRNGLASLGFSWPMLFRVVKGVVISKFKLIEPERCVTLPEFGHLGLQVHRGVKLFDFKRFEVTKIFGNDVLRDEADAEISASRAASSITAAPRFLMADSMGEWFKEKYVRGIHATDLVSPGASDFLRYYPEVEDCLLELAGSQPAVVVKTSEYIESVADSNFSDRWLAAGIDPADVNGISDYIDALRQWLDQNANNEELELVMTHGDFSLVNALVSNGDLRIVDWEGISARSIFGDIFNFALAEQYYERSSPDFVSEAQALFNHYRTAFIARYPDLTDTASIEENIALRIYYLERVRLMIDRDVTPNLNRVVKKSIAMFNQFDVDLGGSPL